MATEVLMEAPLVQCFVDPLVAVRGEFGEAGRDELEALEGIGERVGGQLKGRGARFLLLGL